MGTSALILASGSPRRRELLAQLAIPFSVAAADIDESVHAGESPTAYVQRVAREKAERVALTNPNALVLGADTSVILGEEILGKPEDDAAARAMLGRLSGRHHRVMTAVALAGSAQDVCLAQTTVFFRALTPAEIAWYVATGEPTGKSGSYALQGIGAFMIDRIEGSASNVVGLPLTETLTMLKRAGFTFPWSAS